MSKFNRNNNADMDSKPGSLVDNEVKKLIKQNAHNISTSAMYKLREKYNDQDLLDAIQDGFIERTREIRKKGKKFAKMVKEKYANTIPLHMLLKKAHKFKKKYNLSDAEFAEFRRVYDQALDGDTRPKEYNYTTPFTNMSRVLGQGMIDAEDGLKFDEKDYDSIQQILRLYSECKAQHSQIILQSMEYKDMATQALTGDFDRRRNNPHCHVHPVIAAMFLPKIDIFEETIILANIAYVVKQKYNKKPIMTSNDYELFYNMIRDPTDVVCSGESPVKDLLKRTQLHCKFWESISTLRNGRYYDCAVTHLGAAVESCRRTYEENPDLIYDSDEGSYLTKIFAAFSLRPTVFSQTPVIQSVVLGVTIGTPGYGGPVIPKVHTQPFITVRLPPQAAGLYKNQPLTQIDLSTYVSSYPNFVMEDGTLVQKNNEIIYTNGVLVYYVPRRSNLLNLGKLINPMEFNRLPRVVQGFDRLNKTAINVPLELVVGSQNLHLKSAVLLEKHREENDISDLELIIGNYTILFDADGKAYEYNPRVSALQFEKAGYGREIQNISDVPTDETDPKNPISTVRNYQTPVTCLDGVPMPELEELFNTTGTIFIYKDILEKTKHPLSTLYSV